MNEEKEESSESEDQESEEDGEMACTGGCKGKWSRYRFNELDWNDDPLAEDGLWHTNPVRPSVSSLRFFMVSGIVQCVRCHNWSHNSCVGRPAIHNEDHSADWNCGKCVVNGEDIAQELHVALNCRSRRVGGCLKGPGIRRSGDDSDRMLQMQYGSQQKRQKTLGGETV